MAEATFAPPELPNVITLLQAKFPHARWASYLTLWQNIIYSLLIAFIILLVAYLASRKKKMVPGRLQNALEVFAEGVDDFVCGILGARGRKYTPFIGTLFIYILLMNLIGLVPLMKSSTSSWSTTLALALCVVVYVNYTAIKELGPLGYLYHLMGKPKGVLAFSLVFPLMMFVLHTVSELVRPITLSLRLRSNIWGDDLLLAVVAGFGLKGIPLFVFSAILVIIASFVQAAVFSLLTTIYFTLIWEGKEEREVVKYGY